MLYISSYQSFENSERKKPYNRKIMLLCYWILYDVFMCYTLYLYIMIDISLPIWWLICPKTTFLIVIITFYTKWIRVSLFHQLCISTNEDWWRIPLTGETLYEVLMEPSQKTWHQMTKHILRASALRRVVGFGPGLQLLQALKYVRVRETWFGWPEGGFLFFFFRQ